MHVTPEISYSLFFALAFFFTFVLALLGDRIYAAIVCRASKALALAVA
jgi:hypothetical protein